MSSTTRWSSPRRGVARSPFALRVSHFGGISGSVISSKTKRYWGTQRVARVCQVSPATVANWIDQGHLKGHRTPTGRRRVEGSDLVEFLKAHEMAVPPELGREKGTETVVVVEDDVGYLEALLQSLGRAELDIEVAEATNGVDALLEIGRVRPAVILLDYTLPDLNARQVLERLLAPGRKLDAEVIVVAGGLRDDEAAVLRKLGVKEIVNKADGIAAVVEAVRQALQRWKAA
jgi:CheY-like chemotaxis protein